MLRSRRERISRQEDEAFSHEFGVMCRSAINGKHAPGKTRVFLEFKGFIVRGTARRIEKKKPEGVSWPAIVEEEFLKAGFLHFGLFVGRGGRRRKLIIGIAAAFYCRRRNGR